MSIFEYCAMSATVMLSFMTSAVMIATTVYVSRTHFWRPWAYLIED